VIARGAQGAELLVKVIVLIEDGSLQQTSIGLAFQSMCVDLASKVFYITMINFTLLHGYWDISKCSLYVISIKLTYHHCTIIWTWLQLGHTQSMGVVAPKAPLLKYLEIITDSSLKCSSSHLSTFVYHLYIWPLIPEIYVGIWMWFPAFHYATTANSSFWVPRIQSI